jgi:hypothetical protein
MSLRNTLSIGADLAFNGVVILVLVSSQGVGIPLLISQELAHLLAARTAIKYVRSYEEMVSPSKKDKNDQT